MIPISLVFKTPDMYYICVVIDPRRWQWQPLLCHRVPHTASVASWSLFTWHRHYASPCVVEAVLLVCDAILVLATS